MCYNKAKGGEDNMTNNFKCWKYTDQESTSAQLLTINACNYSLQNATNEEIAKGNKFLLEWYVEREYMVQSCGPNTKAYFDWRSERVEITLSNLIFSNGECIGACYNECIMLTYDRATHRQQKWLGEFITGPDRSVSIYDYYNLKRAK